MFIDFTKYIGRMFSDKDGVPSSTRVMVFMVVLMGCLHFWFILDVWRTLCIQRGEFIKLDLTDFLGGITAIAAILIKIMQTSIESRTPGITNVSDPIKSSPAVTPPPPDTTAHPRRRPIG